MLSRSRLFWPWDLGTYFHRNWFSILWGLLCYYRSRVGLCHILSGIFPFIQALHYYAPRNFEYNRGLGLLFPRGCCCPLYGEQYSIPHLAQLIESSFLCLGDIHLIERVKGKRRIFYYSLPFSRYVPIARAHFHSRDLSSSLRFFQALSPFLSISMFIP